MEESVSKRLGETIRQARIDNDLSQRELAEMIGIDFTYLSKIERARVAPPSDKVLRQIAESLKIDEQTLLDLAAKVSQKDIRETISEYPEAGVLFRHLQSGDLSKEQIQKMVKIARENDA